MQTPLDSLQGICLLWGLRWKLGNGWAEPQLEGAVNLQLISLCFLGEKIGYAIKLLSIQASHVIAHRRLVADINRINGDIQGIAPFQVLFL